LVIRLSDDEFKCNLPRSLEQTSLNLIVNYKTARSPTNSLKSDLNSTQIRNPWSKKQKSAFNTIFTGLKVAKKFNDDVRFLTLTTSEVQYCNKNYDLKYGLNDDFRKLKQRIKRMSVAKLIQQGYIKPSACRKYYPNRSLVEPFSMEYFKVITNEGNGVIHCLYKGGYLPYNFLVDNWQDIHNSWDVNIKLIKNKKEDLKKSSAYVVSQYVSSQKSSFQRSSQSWNWIIRGYRKMWKEFYQTCHSAYFFNPVQRIFYHNRQEVNIFEKWEDMLCMKLKPPPPAPPPQMNLKDFLENCRVAV